MLQIFGITKSFGPTTVLNDVSFHVNPGEKVALTGPNGSGKSTLLDIVAGTQFPDSGATKRLANERLCYLRQGFADDDVTVEIAACSVIPGAVGILNTIRELEKVLAVESAGQEQLRRYSDALAQFDACGGQHTLNRLDESMQRLGISDCGFDTHLSSLSGGQKARVALAGVVAAEPDILLLDEPTNHLDLPSLEWLESFVKGFSGAVLLVSHDRLFLDQIATRILELQPDGTTDSFVGNYSAFVKSKSARRAAELDRWRAQEAEIRRVKADIARQKEMANRLAGKRKPKDPSFKYWAPENTAKIIARRAKTRESKLSRIESSKDRVEKPTQQWRMKLDLGSAKRSGDLLVSIENAKVGYGITTIYESLTAELRHGERIALMGANGVGKSTLFKLLLGELTPSAGTMKLGAGVTVGYVPQQNPVLNDSDTPLSFLLSITDITETDVRNFLHYFLFQGDQVFTPIPNLSFGERSRLTLAGIVVKGPNLLLLDEPLNHLDIPARERFEEALSHYPGTVIVATHDRTFVDSFATSIWWVDQVVGSGQRPATSRLTKYLDRRELVSSGAIV